MSRTPKRGSTSLKRRSRKEQANARQQRARLDPERRRRALLAEETGTILREAPRRVALCYPLPYHTAMSSLGYQVIYRMLNSRPELACERVMLTEDVTEARRVGEIPRSLETGRPLGDFDIIAFSVTYDLDIIGFFDLLDMAGIPLHREDRGPRHPTVILGGPLTASNPLPFGPFIDFAVIGDGEAAVAKLLDVIIDADGRDDLVQRASDVSGVWTPELDGARVPPTQKIAAPYVPAYGQIVTPNTELSNMFLVEASRGCPRFCKFCLVRSRESPMREPELARVLARIPPDAPRVGFVGAAVSEWTGIREALRSVIAMGKGVGVSSLRADRLDEDFVEILRAGGYRTMTVASDAASQRLRNTIGKAIKTRHLIRVAQLARGAGMVKLKLYVIIGLPGETDADITELIEFTRELSTIIPTALGLSPLVPKLHTPLGDAPFAGIPAMDATLKRMRRELRGVADMRSTSAKWAWVEYRMSQGGQDVGLAALEAWKHGNSYASWRDALSGTEERGALSSALEHNLFEAAGMR